MVEEEKIVEAFSAARNKLDKVFDDLIATSAPSVSAGMKRAVGCNEGEIRCGGGEARRNLGEKVINPV